MSSQRRHVSWTWKAGNIALQLTYLLLTFSEQPRSFIDRVAMIPDRTSPVIVTSAPFGHMYQGGEGHMFPENFSFVL